MYLPKILKSFAQAFSKACRSRATPLSLSAESETPLGFAQHLFFLKIGGFYPPIHSLLVATLVNKGGQSPSLNFLALLTLVNKGGLCPPFGGKRC